MQSHVAERGLVTVRGVTSKPLRNRKIQIHLDAAKSNNTVNSRDSRVMDKDS